MKYLLIVWAIRLLWFVPCVLATSPARAAAAPEQLWAERLGIGQESEGEVLAAVLHPSAAKAWLVIGTARQPGSLDLKSIDLWSLGQTGQRERVTRVAEAKGETSLGYLHAAVLDSQAVAIAYRTAARSMRLYVAGTDGQSREQEYLLPESVTSVERAIVHSSSEVIVHVTEGARRVVMRFSEKAALQWRTLVEMESRTVMSITDIARQGQGVAIVGVAGVPPEFERGSGWIGVISASGQLRSRQLDGTDIRSIPALVSTSDTEPLVQLDRAQPGKDMQFQRFSPELVPVEARLLSTQRSENRSFRAAEACRGVFVFATREPDQALGNHIRARVLDAGAVAASFDLTTKSGVDQKVVSKILIDASNRFLLIAAAVGTVGADRRLAAAVDVGLYRAPVECATRGR